MSLTLVEDLEPIDPLAQDRRMHRVLINLELLTYGATYKWNSSMARQKPGGGDCPPRAWGSAEDEAEPLHLYWRARYILAAPHTREDVIAQATNALIMARVRTDPIPEGESRQDWEERLIDEGEGWEAARVAAAFLTGVREVVKVRIAYKRDPNTGRAMDGVTIGQLAQEGLSARQIAAVLPGTKPATAQYYVNRARKAA
ncbi:MAG TPA: hypothetical protein VK631_06675 [Solirubrobacteraceae bacterium]|nr:hypothetical protein [Solirubrobacteraceae bacterium]